MTDNHRITNNTKHSDSRDNTYSRSLTFNKVIDEEDIKYDPNLNLNKYINTYEYNSHTYSTDILNNEKDYHQTNDLEKLNYNKINLEDRYYSTYSNKESKDKYQSQNLNTCVSCQGNLNSKISDPQIPQVANYLRISNLEKRLENLEKMLRFYEDLFRLKEEEKKNEYRIDHNKIAELNNKINFLEKNQNNLNKRLNEQNEILDEKLEIYEKRVLKILNGKNSVTELYANKFAEMEAALNKNEIVFDSLIEEKLSKGQLNFDSKFQEILNLVNDIGKSSESNEFLLVESKEAIRTIQNDHLDIIKIISILKDKTDNIEFIMQQIEEIKEKYNNLIEIYGMQSNEEDKFLQKILQGNNSEK